GLQRPDHQIILLLQIDLAVIRSKISPHAAFCIIRSHFNDSPRLLHLAQPVFSYKVIFHTLLLSVPDRPCCIRNDPLKLRHSLRQFFIDSILPGRTLSHDIENLTHLSTPRSFRFLPFLLWKIPFSDIRSSAALSPFRSVLPVRQEEYPGDRDRHIQEIPFCRHPPMPQSLSSPRCISAAP